MRICLYSDATGKNPGGSQKVFTQLANSLVRSGASVSIFSRCTAMGGWPDCPVTVYRKPMSKRLAVRATLLPQLLLHHSRYPFDILHCHSAFPAGYVGTALGQINKNIRTVIRPHGTDILEGEPLFQRPSIARRITTGLRLAHRVAAQSEALELRLKELGVEPERIVRIPNGVHLPDEVSFQREPDAPWLGIGSLSYKKGWDFLLQAYAQLPLPRRKLVILGEGDQRAKLEEIIARLKIREEVSLPGAVPASEVEHHLQRAWYLLLPSRREPFSNALLEALAHGVPALASHTGGNIEVMDHDGNGFLLPEEDGEAWMSKMKELHGNAELRKRLAHGARETAAGYSWEAIFKQYMAMYESLMNLS